MGGDQGDIGAFDKAFSEEYTDSKGSSESGTIGAAAIAARKANDTLAPPIRPASELQTQNEEETAICKNRCSFSPTLIFKLTHNALKITPRPSLSTLFTIGVATLCTAIAAIALVSFGLTPIGLSIAGGAAFVACTFAAGVFIYKRNQNRKAIQRANDFINGGVVDRTAEGLPIHRVEERDENGNLERYNVVKL